MAFPGNVTRYIWSGTLPSGERWATGFYGQPLAVGGAQAQADAVDDAGSLGLAAMTAMRALMSPQASIARFQVYTYGTGRTIVDQGDVTLALAGTGGTTLLPNQTCAVLTLRTALRSRRGRGRMYFPATGATLASTGLFTSTVIQALANGVGPYMDGNGAVVVSETGTISTPVDRVDADLRPDVQRRRADSMASSRVGYNFTP